MRPLPNVRTRFLSVSSPASSHHNARPSHSRFLPRYSGKMQRKPSNFRLNPLIVMAHLGIRECPDVKISRPAHVPQPRPAHRPRRSVSFDIASSVGGCPRHTLADVRRNLSLVYLLKWSMRPHLVHPDPDIFSRSVYLALESKPFHTGARCSLRQLLCRKYH